MPKVQDIAYVMYQVPDLRTMETFLTDFGLARAQRTPDALYMRAADTSPYCHVSYRGNVSPVGVGFSVESADDLRAAIAIPGASAIEPVDGPGGGYRVRLSTPSGMRIDLVHGVA